MLPACFFASFSDKPSIVNKSSIAIFLFLEASTKSLNDFPNTPHLALILSISLSNVLNIVLFIIVCRMWKSTFVYKCGVLAFL